MDVGRVLDVSRYFINGKYFASMGEIYHYKTAAMRPFLRTISSNFLQKEGPNFL
ncbi:MAG: hypothetical protein N3A69_03520 [Leptospiraceae bacterium]|nr:hypothetical protein [Leptospiraceae bacterium]